MTASPEFGDRLRRHRHAAGLTIVELAAASGVSVRAVGDMERGRSRAPQRRTVDALVAALGLAGPAAAELRRAARAGRRPQPAMTGLAPPRSVADFTGRTTELAWLGSLATRAETGPTGAGPPGAGPPPVAVICGPPGLGKTTVMLQAARQFADSFPDGVLFLDLRGLDPDPPAAGDLARSLLIALGVEAAQVAAEPAARSAQYRAVVRSRRCLVLLDNAAGEAQVRPLLPGEGGTLTLISSRRSLTGLEAVDRIRLPALATGDGETLLRRIIGPDRAGAEPEPALRGLVEVCGGLPLALRIAGNRLLSRPGWTVRYLLQELTSPQRRTDLLVAGDLQIAGPFRLSHRQLSATARRVFRRLALAPGPDTGADLAGHLAGLGAREAAGALAELAELGLLQPAGDGRYRFHDLIRLFARERLAEEEPAGEPQRIEERMVGWLLDRAVEAGRRFEPAGAGDQPPARPDATAQAARWITQESPHWLAALRAVAAAGRHFQVMTAVDAMHWFSDRWVHWGQWLEVFQLGADAARAVGDPARLAVHLGYLAWAYTTCERRPELALAPAQEALAQAQAAGDRSQQGWAQVYLGYAHEQCGDATPAQAAAHASLALFEAAGDWDGYSQGIGLLARSHATAGQHRAAIAQYERLEALLTDPDRRPSAVVSDLTTGQLHLHIGHSLLAQRRWVAAAGRFRSALPLLQDAGQRQGEARCRYGWGCALARLGRVTHARAELRRAVRLGQQVGLKDLADQALAVLAGLDRPGRPVAR